MDWIIAVKKEWMLNNRTWSNRCQQYQLHSVSVSLNAYSTFNSKLSKSKWKYNIHVNWQKYGWMNFQSWELIYLRSLGTLMLLNCSCMHCRGINIKLRSFHLRILNMLLLLRRKINMQQLNMLRGIINSDSQRLK